MHFDLGYENHKVDFMILTLQWFNDVSSKEISQKCENVLNLLSEDYNCQVKDFSFKYSNIVVL